MKRNTCAVRISRWIRTRVASRENDTGGWGFDGCLDGMIKGVVIGVPHPVDWTPDRSI
jgi:hypothetical protein